MVIFALLVAGCAWITAEDAAARRDQDGDGYSADVDCDDQDATISPGADEPACATTDQDCSGVLNGSVDADGDGLTACAGDCDDALADIPAETETCNGKDDDCDGEIDNNPSNPSTFYADGDIDGFGDPSATATGCSAPSGFVANDDDCDDQNPDAFPGAAEDCAAADLDCNGDPTEGATVGTSTYYLDDDADGYGTTAEQLCLLIEGYSASTGDCDDADAQVNPDQAEVCDDHVDNDCDGGLNACGLAGEHSFADESVALRLDAGEGDDFGYSVAGGADLDAEGDGGADLVVGAPGANGGAGRVGVYLSAGSGFGTIELSLSDFGLDANAGLGESVAVGQYGEVDEIGILIGAPGAAGAGAAWFCLPDDALVFDCPISIAGSANSDAGSQVAIYGDGDDSGLGTWVVSARGAADAGANSGSLYLFQGSPRSGGTLADVADRLLTGENTSDAAGTSLSSRSADVDGDGINDWMAGAPAASSSAGAAYLLSVTAATGSLSGANAKLAGETTGDQAGRSVAVVSDTNGDGYADVVVGASAEDSGGSSGGAAYLVLGPVTTSSLSSATAKLLGDAGEYAGWSVSGIGDVDDDGVEDWAVGSLGGNVYVVRSLVTGAHSLGTADATLVQEASGDKAGWAVAPAGDLDADGYDDFAVGAYGFGNPDSGAAYVVWGTGG